MFTTGDLDSNILLPGFFVDNVKAPLLLGSFAQIKRRNPIPADQVADALAGVRMIRQHPHTLADVLGDIEELADVCGADARPLLSSLQRRIEAATREASALPRVRGVFLEWLGPPYPAGHWTPD